MNETDDILKFIEDDKPIEQTKHEDIILGIDLGTTNSCVSIWRNNKCEVIPDEFGNKTVPSYVSFTNISKYVGVDAKKQKDINTENVFYEVKRLIGRTFDDKSVQDCKNLLSYNIVKNDRGCISLQSTIKNDKQFTPEEISSIILMKLKDMACKYLNQEVKNVVITVPAHFNDTQRQATKDAATIAGLNCVRMFHEPTAAALAYGLVERTIDKDKAVNILVYDFGGGTLDVSLIEIYNGVFDVKGTSGNSQFGGVDFDNRLIKFCLAKFSKSFKQFDVNKLSCLSLQKLRTQCEICKKMLSTNMSSVIFVDNFYEDNDLLVKITRQDFENICRDLFLLCMYPIDSLINECDINHIDVDEVILIGGMTRMPYIRELLNTKFPSKINCSINPDEAVSVGASIQGYMLSHQNDSAFSDAVTLLDVTPLTLGVEINGGIMDTIIKRNTMIPCEKTKMYTNVDDFVDSIMIKIYEGERVMTEHNCKIGEFILENLPKVKRGDLVIHICFSIDINGIVTVTANEKNTNETKTIIVNTNKNGLKQNEIQQLVEEAREQETMDEINKTKIKYYYEITELCTNIKTNLSNKDFKLTETDIQTTGQDINEIIQWLKTKKPKNHELDDYDLILNKIKKKYGVLILGCSKSTDKNVKAISEHIDATLIYSKDDDEEEDELRQAYEKIKTEEIDGMTDNEIIELNNLRKSLIELCQSINQIIDTNKIKLSTEHKKELYDYVNDVILWYYSHEKPTINEYKEKIDSLNEVCDQVVDTYNNQHNLNDDINYYDELEKLTLTLLTLINEKQIKGNPELVEILANKLNEVIKYLYDDDGECDMNICKSNIDTINELCNKVYNSMQNIDIQHGPIIDSRLTDFGLMYETKEKDNDTVRGMSMMELIKQKQQSEIEDIINRD